MPLPGSGWTNQKVRHKKTKKESWCVGLAKGKIGKEMIVVEDRSNNRRSVMANNYVKVDMFHVEHSGKE